MRLTKKYYEQLTRYIIDSVKSQKLLELGDVHWELGDAGDGNHGIFYHLPKLLVVNPNQNRYNFIRTLLHELVHAEQNYTGRYKLVLTNGYVELFWNDELYPPIDPSWIGMFPPPWEEEAFNKELELVNLVYKDLMKKNILPLGDIRCRLQVVRQELSLASH